MTDRESDNNYVSNNIVTDNNKLKYFLENNGFVNCVDFSDFDPRVAYDLAKSIIDAKNDFPNLEINYIGSIGNQVKGLHSEIEISQFYFYMNNGFDESLARQMAKQYADDFINKNKLNETEGTYAWSLKTGDPDLDYYAGVAINNDYAKDYESFKDSKKADEIAKWAPIGCGSPKAVTDHELGHEIDKLLDASQDGYIIGLYNEMMKNDNAESVLSGYSRKNVKEFIAEAYSEYRNNKNPREISTLVFERLIFLRDQKVKQKILTRR